MPRKPSPQLLLFPGVELGRPRRARRKRAAAAPRPAHLSPRVHPRQHSLFEVNDAP
jgi:hypothetical protein